MKRREFSLHGNDKGHLLRTRAVYRFNKVDSFVVIGVILMFTFQKLLIFENCRVS